MTGTLISFGTNVAGPDRDLAAVHNKALGLIGSTPGLEISAASRLFRTPAWPPGSGPEFLNAALSVTTDLAPEAVLRCLHAVEDHLGRTRPVRWGPRVCDLDLLIQRDEIRPDAATVRRWMALGDDQAIARAPDRLLLPHPRLHRRGFVLLPLMDIAPEARHPILGLTVAEMAAALPLRLRQGIAPQ